MIPNPNRLAWPKISIVTPVRNSCDTLRQTVDSVISQEYPNLEYVVIDGGSTDGSLETIYESAQDVDVFIYGKDRNLYDALAKAFAACHGDVLGWLNADDMYEPGILRRVGRIFASHPDWEVVYFDGTVWKQGWRVPNRNQRYVGLPELMAGHILFQDSVFFRRRAYEAVGGLDRIRFRLAGDYDLWIRLAERFSFHYIPETASCFRIRSGQLSGDWNAYIGEMDLARSEARRRQVSSQPRSAGRSFAAIWRRRRKSEHINKRRRFNYPLRDEQLAWPPVTTGSLPALSTCCCSVCGSIPERLLFSTPDTWYGDRRIWHIYYCTRCALSILFPSATANHNSEGPRQNSEDVTSVGPVYKLFAGPRLLGNNPLYVRAARKFHLFRKHASDLPRIRERHDAPLLEIGCGEGRLLEHLSAAGYTKVSGLETNCALSTSLINRGYRVTNADFFSTSPPCVQFHAVIFHLTLEYLHDPLAALLHLRGWLRRGGRAYIVTPNLDSVWLERYGPVWSRWHAPFHRFLFGPSALRRLAAKAGFRVRSFRSCSPPQWLYQSDLLSEQGLGGSVPPTDGSGADTNRWQQALGASVLAAIRWDWRLRGDCLHAVMVKKG